MYKKMFSLLILLAAGIFLSGCLTCEYKQYSFSVDGDGSGKLTIKYYNIMSQKYGEDDSPEKDFKELIDDYINGEKLQEDFPLATVSSKKLTEQNGKLVGEVTYSFPALNTIKLFKYDDKSPLMFHISSMNETYEESNGYYDGEVMPVVFWERGSKNLTLKTKVAGVPEAGDESYTSLVKQYRQWKKSN